MDGIDLWVLLFVGCFVSITIGFYNGYRRGVEDTEERWSDVVKKAEWERARERAT